MMDRMVSSIFGRIRTPSCWLNVIPDSDRCHGDYVLVRIVKGGWRLGPQRGVEVLGQGLPVLLRPSRMANITARAHRRSIDEKCQPSKISAAVYYGVTDDGRSSEWQAF